jgi:hypothetical protein
LPPGGPDRFWGPPSLLSNGYQGWPRHSSGGYSPASHRGGPGSNPGLVMWDFVMEKSGAGAGFLRELRFPLHNLHSTYFSTIIFTITRGWHNRPGVAAVPIASQTRIKKKLVPGTFPCGYGGSHPTSAEVKKTWIYTSTPQYAFMASCLIS